MTDRSPASRARNRRGLRRKRVFDLAVALPLCVVAAPVILGLAAVVAYQLRANPFFVHDRIGYQGRIIRLVKLRTLSVATPAYADKSTTDLAPPTRLTRVLRFSHLDELPQLFQVVTGRLSLVGPRPRMVAEAEAFADEQLDEMLTSVPQGCTGLWQVSVAQAGRVSDSPEYARLYVAHRSLRLDGWILWRTVTMTLGRRPVELEQVPRWVMRSPPSDVRA